MSVYTGVDRLDCRGLVESARVVHLYSGAPPVRSWSKYQNTIREWTLCGVHRQLGGTGRGQPAQCTESAAAMSCPYCLSLCGAEGLATE
jgi:hypothetical protein